MYHEQQNDCNRENKINIKIFKKGFYVSGIYIRIVKVNFKKGLAASYFMFQAAGTFKFVRDCETAKLLNHALVEPDAIVWQFTATCVHTHEAIIVMNDPYDNISLIYIPSQSILSLSTWSANHKTKGN